MTRRLAIAAALVAQLALAAPAPSAQAAGSRVRYALVVGSNSGTGGPHPLAPLRHAEAEARRLRDSLVRYGNFDHRRVALVAGGGRAEVLRAAGRLAQLHATERESLGDVQTLFAFFFTGHGVEGRLLTGDQPLDTSDLAGVFERMGADLTFGFFDACYAESMGGVISKGAVPTGFNPLRALPAEVIDAEGTVLLVSSRPDELSYEDERHGGLFTHYFLEAFTKAPQDEVGITLDRMWEYVRGQTSSHAARLGLRQTPVKIVRRLKTRAPLYFSFPRERGATMRFDAAVGGTFMLRYADAALVETVTKRPGRRLDVPVYPGRLVLARAGTDVADQAPTRELVLARGQSVRVSAADQVPAGALPGYRRAAVRGKGELPGLAVTEAQPSLAVALGVGYALRPVPDGVLGAQHALDLSAWLTYGRLSVALGLSHGWRETQFSTWGYRLHQSGVGFRAGYGLPVASGRLDLEAGADLTWLHVDYLGSGSRDEPGALLATGARVSWPLLAEPAVRLHLRASLGARLSYGLAREATDVRWAFEPALQVGLGFPLD